MMRTLFKIGVALFLLACVLVGVAASLLKANGVVNRAVPEERAVASEARPVTAEATRIMLSGPVHLILRQGAVPSMLVRGEERLLGQVSIVQNGDMLSIGMRGMVLHHRHPPQVTLVLPDLASLQLTGTGDSEVNGFNGEQIRVSMAGRGTLKFNGRYKQVRASLTGNGDMEMNGGASDEVDIAQAGSGDMTVVGSAKEFRIKKSGSGDFDAEHMAADDTDLESTGSGDAIVQARKKIQVALTGSGEVIVIGNPGERSIQRDGSGSVEFRQ